MKTKTGMKLLALSMSAMFAVATPTLAFGEDIDIFTGASAGESIAPKILFVLDNQSFWSNAAQGWPTGKAGQGEVRAIKKVIEGIDPAISAGLFEFVAEGNANQTGGFVRSHLAVMNDANKAAFIKQLDIIDANITSTKEKRNSGTEYGRLLHDVYSYFSGGASNDPTAVDAERADADGYLGAGFTTFKSPLTTAGVCGRVYIIFVGNPAQSGPSSDIANNTTALKNLGGNTSQIVTPGLVETAKKFRNADEWARFMYEKGVKLQGSDIRMPVTTYTIDVFKNKPDGEQTALLKSMAKSSNGRYHMANSDEDILEAMKSIVIEIQASDSAFASTSLPVNATNRSQKDNQVFIGMFRPDADSRPRWFGNLKRYQLVPGLGGFELGDVNGKAAVNSDSAFVTPCATSYWTSDTTVPLVGGGTTGYWNMAGLKPKAESECKDLKVNTNNLLSDAPDGPQVEKGGAAQILRQGNVANGAKTDRTLNRKMYTLETGTDKTVVELTAANILKYNTLTDLLPTLDLKTVNYIRGADVNLEKGDDRTLTRPSIHGDVIHSRPMPINYGIKDNVKQGVTVYYGANDGALRALNAENGTERWSFVAPEFFPRFARLTNNAPLIDYAFHTEAAASKNKDYFFDGSIGLYQNKDSSKIWIYPSMRRGGRMVYAFDVSQTTTPVIKWRAGCTSNDGGCSDGLSDIGQTWSIPSPAFIRGTETVAPTVPMVVMGGGYDRCEDEDVKEPNCSDPKGNNVYILNGDTGKVEATFPTDRSVAADVSMVDVDHNGFVDYAYVADTGGSIYRIDFVSSPTTLEPLAKDKWKIKKVAVTSGGHRKFLFHPALFATAGKVYVAIGSGDREHPLAKQYPYAEDVKNRFYVYMDDPIDDKAPVYDLDTLANDRTSTNTCAAPDVLPKSNMRGWYINLLKGEQVVTSALIAAGMVTFNTNMPTPDEKATCSSNLGEAGGYWLNLFNGSGTMGAVGTCGGERRTKLVGGGIPPSAVLATNVDINGNSETVIIGAPRKDMKPCNQMCVEQPNPPIAKKRRRAYSNTAVD